jgi:hypothetical protein
MSRNLRQKGAYQGVEVVPNKGDIEVPGDDEVAGA